MTKQELIEHLAETEDIPFESAEAIVEEFLRLIEDRMKRGEETQIYSFGKFGVRWWKGRIGRDPQTGEEIELDGRWIPYWTPSPSLVDETEEHQAAVEAGKIDEVKESVEKVEVTSEISYEQQEEVSESTSSGEQDEEKEKDEPDLSEQEEIAAEDSAAEEPIQEAGSIKEEPSEEPELIDSFEPIPGEKAPEEEETEPDNSKIPAFMFRESEEDEEVTIEPDLPDAVESDEQYIEESDIEREVEEKEYDEKPFTAESSEAMEAKYAEDESEDVEEDVEPEWERHARDKAKTRDSDESREGDMPWLYPEKKESKNWLPTILIVLLLMGIAGAAYYLMVDRPDFLTNMNLPSIEEPVSDGDQELSGGDTQTDGTQEEPIQDATEAGERASVSSDDVPEPEPAIPVARSISTPENVDPYIFNTAGTSAFMDKYNQALTSFEEGNYLEAERIFQRLQISDPPDDYADNTQYWIGECKFGMGHYRESIRAFEEVFIYPNTNKVDDSLLMMASAYIHLNEMQQAGEILRKFQNQYSNSQYAPIAQRWIARYNL